MDPDPFDDLMAAADPAMVVVTTAQDGERAGCLVGFHAQSSIEPRRYCVWLSKANHTGRVVRTATHLAVHLLGDHQRSLAEHFGTRSGDDVDKFADQPWSEGTGGVPLLSDCPDRFLARVVAILDEGGDHLCVVSQPEGAEGAGPDSPLKLSAVVDLVPGHEAEERPSPPDHRSS